MATTTYYSSSPKSLSADPLHDHGNSRHKTVEQNQQNGFPATLFHNGVTYHHSYDRSGPTFQDARACAGHTRHFICMMRVLRLTGKGPRPLYSGPQGKSDLCVQRADWTSDQCHCHCHLVSKNSHEWQMWCWGALFGGERKYFEILQRRRGSNCEGVAM